MLSLTVFFGNYSRRNSYEKSELIQIKEKLVEAHDEVKDFTEQKDNVHLKRKLNY